MQVSSAYAVSLSESMIAVSLSLKSLLESENVVDLVSDDANPIVPAGVGIVMSPCCKFVISIVVVVLGSVGSFLLPIILCTIVLSVRSSISSAANQLDNSGVTRVGVTRVGVVPFRRRFVDLLGVCCCQLPDVGAGVGRSDIQVRQIN